MAKKDMAARVCGEHPEDPKLPLAAGQNVNPDVKYDYTCTHDEVCAYKGIVNGDKFCAWRVEHHGREVPLKPKE